MHLLGNAEGGGQSKDRSKFLMMLPQQQHTCPSTSSPPSSGGQWRAGPWPSAYWPASGPARRPPSSSSPGTWLRALVSRAKAEKETELSDLASLCLLLLLTYITCCVWCVGLLFHGHRRPHSLPDRNLPVNRQAISRSRRGIKAQPRTLRSPLYPLPYITKQY